MCPRGLHSGFFFFFLAQPCVLIMTLTPFIEVASCKSGHTHTYTHTHTHTYTHTHTHTHTYTHTHTHKHTQTCTHSFVHVQRIILHSSHDHEQKKISQLPCPW